MEVHVDTSEVQKAFKKVLQIVNNEIPWKSIGIDAELSIDQNFVAGGRYQDKDNPIGGSKKWVPRKKAYPWPILDNTMSLRQSIYSKADKNSVVVGSKGLPYNRAQNYGYGPGGIPARPFMTIHPDDVNKIVKDISDAIVREFE